MLYNISEILLKIIDIIVLIVAAMFCFRVVYAVLGFFTTRKFKPAKQMHKYAILVAARNEESVIGNLIHSVKSQDYPSELVTIFVVADNCTDNTAEIARKSGAVCYERKDDIHRTKGYALQFLVECIRKDYGIDAFEGYFIFDADNLLNKDYVKQMNNAFDAGEKIITSYRNTKNFGDNWISASYALHWMRTIRTEHRARSVLRLATRIQGTGFLFAHELIKDGWNFTSLTEDRAFCADAVARGYTISYNDKAEFFDEQPVNIKIAMRQRIRWSKGHIQAFSETGFKLFSHIFVTHGAANKLNSKDNVSIRKKLLLNIRLRIISLDMLSVVFPRNLFDTFKNTLVFILEAILISGGFLTLTEKISAIYTYLFDFAGISLEFNTAWAEIAFLSMFTLLSTLIAYSSSILVGAYIFITEHKHIKNIKWYKKAFYCLTFPLFGIIGKISMIIAFFSKVEWKPIPHNVTISIDDIEKNNK